MARCIKATKYLRREEQHRTNYPSRLGNSVGSHQAPQASISEVDENLVSMFMGWKIQYNQYGQIVEDEAPHTGPAKYTERDIEIFETQSDLWWCYARQDAYQSILGGGPLFMSYNLWSRCPPRAALGQLNATFGTFDHLVLLLGRLGDFISRDVKRKRMAMKANGGYWSPPQDNKWPTPNSQHGTSPTRRPPSMPSFNGLIPSNPQPQLPMGFSPTEETYAPFSNQSQDVQLEAARLEAEDEWQDIRNAFSIFEHHLGHQFQPLGPEFSKPIRTPFGPALQYRTYAIAIIWINYYFGIIACTRANPSMPPAATMASTMAASQTEFAANEVGRIAAGIAPDLRGVSQVNPGVGAALIGCAPCLLVAGVQVC